MGWFGITTDKDPKEAAYNRGEKSFKDVIQNESPGELLYAIDPREDFNTGSTLIVHPGEVALFEKNGVIQQEFPEGRYVLSTENYPFISTLRNMFSGGVSSFNCRIHYFRDTDSSEIKWGTQSPIAIEDRIYNQEVHLGVAAVYKIKIENPILCLKKLLGNNIYIKSEGEMNKYWGGELESIIREVIYNTLRAYPNTMLDIIHQTRSISKSVQSEVDETISEYGIKLVKFSIVAINILDDFIERVRANKDITRNASLYGVAKDIESQAEAKARINIAQGDLGVMETLGDNWGRQQAAEILKNVSLNPGAGGIASAGAGLGMGMSAGSVFAGMANQIFTPFTQQPQQQHQPQHSPSGRFTQRNDNPAQAQPQNNSRFQQQNEPSEFTGAPVPPPIKPITFYAYINDTQMGPYDIKVLGQLVQSGHLTPETLVWKEGLSEWVMAKNTELANLFNTGNPVIPPTPPTLPK